MVTNRKVMPLSLLPAGRCEAISNWPIRCVSKVRSMNTRVSIDAMSTAAQDSGDAVKILTIADRHGLQLSAIPHATNLHGVTLMQLNNSFDFYILKATPGAAHWRSGA